MKKLGELVKLILFKFYKNIIYKRGGKNIEQLNLYRIEEKYAKYISKQDSKILKSSGQKNTRPYLGIIININNINYFAPLSSPKEKHRKMKSNIDFIKINNGRDGVINLNNMLPITLKNCTKIDIKEEMKKDKKYGLILKYQIIWCNNNKYQIIKKAEKLYYLIIENKANMKIKERCCNFKLLESKLNQYILNQEKSE